MLGFARKNDAVISKAPIRRIFIPIHMIYASLVIWAICNENMAHCSKRTYPKIFSYQYGLFFLTYFGFLFLHSKNYFMEWHESVKHIDLQDEASHIMLDDPTKRRLKVRIIFE